MKPRYIAEPFSSGSPDPLLSPFSVASSVAPPDNPLFWQFPCRTEEAAATLHQQPWLRTGPYRRHASGIHLPDIDGAPSPDIYIALPWATFIDRQQWPDAVLNLVRQRLHSYRVAFMLRSQTLRVHTVCQHIFWERFLPVFKRLGITDLHVSHLPESLVGRSPDASLTLHPWTLYAVNIEEADRRMGLTIGKPMPQRSLLASFIGAHDRSYLSPVRERLLQFQGRKEWLIQITGSRWHFESLVYDWQVKGQSMSAPVATDTVENYNRILSDTQFALCPSGTGPNSLRLWEAMAVGCIPVLLGIRPALPPCPQVTLSGWTKKTMWTDVLLTCEDEDLVRLPERLEAMPLAEKVMRQRVGMAVWQALRDRRCFG